MQTVVFFVCKKYWQCHFGISIRYHKGLSKSQILHFITHTSSSRNKDTDFQIIYITQVSSDSASI